MAVCSVDLIDNINKLTLNNNTKKLFPSGFAGSKMRHYRTLGI